MKIISSARLQIIGSGGSMGIPVVGCPCAICQSKDPHNQRLRPSALLKVGKQQILIDCGPDFRMQGLKNNIDHLDGVILTHAHHDHTAGIDELRIFTLRSGKSLPCLLSHETLKELQVRFYYIFNEPTREDGVKLMTNFALHLLPNTTGDIDFLGLKVRYLSYYQGGMQVTGFRFGDLAYLTDIKDYPQDIFEALDGIKTLVISALRYTPSPLHFTVDDAIAFSEKVGAKNTYLTHIAHELDHDKTNAYLPESIRLGYDGLELHFEAELT